VAEGQRGLKPTSAGLALLHRFAELPLRGSIFDLDG
jgi:hypothetical protein